jgi:hypothetical protein
MISSSSAFYDDGTVTNRVLLPYLDAVSNVSSLNDSTTTVVRAVIHKLLQDSNIFMGYNIMKHHLLTKTTMANTAATDGETTTTTTTRNVDSKVLNTLDLFSYGTISDYMVDQEHKTYLTLTEAQLTKLRQLTALSVIIDHHHRGIVSYYDIHAAAFANINDGSSNSSIHNSASTISMLEPDQAAVTISSAAAKATTIRETESLLSPLIASKMIVGKLSQKKMSFILGIGNNKNDQNTATNNGNTNSTGNNSIDSGSAATADSTFSKSLLVIQSRDINVHAPDASTNILPKLLSSIQRMRSQINDAHQHLITISQPEQQQQSVPTGLDRSVASSTMMTTTMPMEVERIRLTTTTTSAKRSRCSDGSTQNS